MDTKKIEEGVRLILEGVGENPEREGLRETPARVARMYEEILAGLHEDPAELFVKKFNEGHQEMVLVHDIPVYSICEHHLVPFYGVAHVAYVPNPARLVDLFARRPQVQERLTSQVADTLVKELDPQGVLVVLECEHLCMSMRGVKKPGSKTTTSAVRGSFITSAETRAEALSLIRQGR